MQSLPEAQISLLNRAAFSAFRVKGKIRPEVESVMTMRHTPPPPGFRYVFRPWRTCPKTGTRLYARAFGLRAWPILIPE